MTLFNHKAVGSAKTYDSLGSQRRIMLITGAGVVCSTLSK